MLPGRLAFYVFLFDYSPLVRVNEVMHRKWRLLVDHCFLFVFACYHGLSYRKYVGRVNSVF